MSMQAPYSRMVRDIVFDTLAQQGRAPSIAEIARITGSETDEVQHALNQLADDHALVLSRDGDAIRMAHPFSAAPMAFVVTPSNGRDDRRWWGGCAWDSFGISAAVGIDVRIDSTCPLCGASLTVFAGPDMQPEGDYAVRFPRPAAEWWSDVVATCTMIRLFCNQGHAVEWTDEHAPGSGYIAEAATVWRLAQPWYGDRIAPDFTPHTRDFNQQLLQEVGLTGPFWRLP